MLSRTSRFAFAQLHGKATRRIAADFLRALVAAAPDTIHTALTDKGTRFVDSTPASPEAEAAAIRAACGELRLRRVHAFAHACEQNGIEHGLTKPRHPWTRGHVERINRPLTDATVRRRHDASHDRLGAHLPLFLDACSHARRLETLGGRTPYGFVCQAWTNQPARFTLNPTLLTPGLYG